jgi:L-lactate dehydrogenase complex protein LldG
MMNSRDKILNTVAANQPPLVGLPDIEFLKAQNVYSVESFINTLTKIGGTIIPVEGIGDVHSFISQKFRSGERVVTTLPALQDSAEFINVGANAPHTLHNIDHVIIETNCGVAENGAVWVTESMMGERVLPFICQHLYVILNALDIVSTMHDAYEKIGADDYGFGSFIAGPSKTADIEQSLVIGAHGPRSMSVFLIG